AIGIGEKERRHAQLSMQVLGTGLHLKSLGIGTDRRHDRVRMGMPAIGEYIATTAQVIPAHDARLRMKLCIVPVRSACQCCQCILALAIAHFLQSLAYLLLGVATLLRGNWRHPTVTRFK